jgi:hypothetical protein
MGQQNRVKDAEGCRRGDLQGKLKMRKLMTPFASAVGSLMIAAASFSGMVSRPVVNAYAAPGSWSPTANLPQAQGGRPAVILGDGRVLVGQPAPLLYDPANGTWTGAGNPTSGAYVLTRLNGGSVLAMAAGPAVYIPSRNETTTELFDPATGTWTRTGNMSHGRAGYTATLLKDGRVLVAGGEFCIFDGCFAPPPPRYVSAELYDPLTGAWTPTGSMMQYREGHTATLLNDGRVLVAGGAGCTAELFDPSTGTWTQTGNVCGGTATLLGDGKVLFVGGRTADLYDPGTQTSSPTAGATDARTGHTATLLLNGKVLVAGGAVDCPAGNGEALQLNTSEEYDPVSATWGSRTFLRTGRQSHSATLLTDGRVLVAGGVARIFQDELADGCFSSVLTETAETYTP